MEIKTFADVLVAAGNIGNELVDSWFNQAESGVEFEVIKERLELYKKVICDDHHGMLTAGIGCTTLERFLEINEKHVKIVYGSDAARQLFGDSFCDQILAVSNVEGLTWFWNTEKLWENPLTQEQVDGFITEQCKMIEMVLDTCRKICENKAAS